ncbi:MAG: hypothetical protein ABEJ76_09735 [Halanaeroarchaeum sp.]
MEITHTNRRSFLRFLGASGSAVALTGTIPGARAETTVGEVGSVTTDQPDIDTWHAFTYENSYDSPVVFMGPVGSNGNQPVHVRLKDVSESEARYRLEEWKSTDGSHTTETIYYVVIEAGTHSIGGQQVTAGTVSVDDDWKTVSYPTGFQGTPVVLSVSQTNNGPDRIITRTKGVSANSFSVRVQEAEGSDENHTTEQVGYVAFEQGTGSVGSTSFTAGRTGAQVDDSTHTVSFNGNFGESPAFLADAQTANGSDTANVRYGNLSGNSVDLFVEEEKTNDWETDHATEVVGYVVFDHTGILGAQTSTTNPPSTTTTTDTGGSDPGGGSTDPSFIRPGETKSGRIEQSDQRDPFYGGPYHSDPITFQASSSTDLKIEMQSDAFSPWIRLEGPGGETIKVTAGPSKATLSLTAPDTGTYTIWAQTTQSGATGPYSVSLVAEGSTGTTPPGSGGYHRLQVVDDAGDGMSGARVRILHLPDDLSTPDPSAIEVIAEAESGSDGIARFDGTSGQAIPVDQLSQFRSTYSGRILMTGWTDESRPWFGAFERLPSDFFSTEWVGSPLPLNQQLLFGPTNGPGQQGTATVWRSLAPSESRRQELYVSVSSPDVVGGAMTEIGAGLLSFRVPETVTVDYPLRSLKRTTIQGKPVAGSLAVSDAYPGLPPSLPLWNTAYEYAGNEGEAAREAFKGIVGQLPVVGTLTGFGQTMMDIFDVGEGVQYTIGPGSETDLNRQDVVSASWKSPTFEYVYNVPIVFPDDQERTFAARGMWSTSVFTGNVHLDAPFTIGPIG